MSLLQLGLPAGDDQQADRGEDVTYALADEEHRVPGREHPCVGVNGLK